MKARTVYIVLGAVVGLCVQVGCQTARPNTAAGGLFGAAAGSVLGAAIGAHEGKIGEGALIGGLAGGSLGGLMGNQADQADARDARLYQAQLQSQRDAAISMDQVVQLTRSGLSDDVIANQIQRQGILASPTNNDLILLKQNGVSDRVIAALQSAPIAGNQLPVQTPLVVQPDVMVVDPVCPPVLLGPLPPPHYRHFHPGHRRSSVGISVGF